MISAMGSTQAAAAMASRVRLEAGRGTRPRFTRAALRACLRDLPRAEADHLIDAAAGLGRQVELLARADRSAANGALGPLALAQPWVQYPPESADDACLPARYYFHRHGTAAANDVEYGHFHLFVRHGVSDHAHVLAIAVDARGLPVRLFTTNRWVTAEHWLPADRVLALAARRSFTATGSSETLNRWVTGCVRLFEPQVRWLLRRRDQRLRELSSRRSRDAVFEDRRVECMSQCRISLCGQITALQTMLDE